MKLHQACKIANGNIDALLKIAKELAIFTDKEIAKNSIVKILPIALKNIEKHEKKTMQNVGL